MRQIGQEEIAALINRIPNVPENASALDELHALFREQGIVRFPFTYSMLVPTLAAAAVSTQTIAIDAAAPFLIVNQTFFTDATAQLQGTQILPLVSLLLTDTSSNRQMSDQAVAIPCMFGNGQFPYILPEPKLMPANSILQGVFTNFSAGTTYTNLRVYFSGFKLYSNQQG